MAYREHSRTAFRDIRSLASSSSTAAEHRGALGTADAFVPILGITIFGCRADEAAVFREVAPRFGIAPTITDGALSEANIGLANGNRCISVGHKTPIANARRGAAPRRGAPRWPAA